MLKKHFEIFRSFSGVGAPPSPLSPKGFPEPKSSRRRWHIMGRSWEWLEIWSGSSLESIWAAIWLEIWNSKSFDDWGIRVIHSQELGVVCDYWKSTDFSISQNLKLGFLHYWTNLRRLDLADSLGKINDFHLPKTAREQNTRIMKMIIRRTFAHKFGCCHIFQKLTNEKWRNKQGGI